MMFPKHKRVRVKSRVGMERLNDEIHERDGHKCIVTGQPVDPGVMFHHVLYGNKKEDVIENGVTLAPEIHWIVHFSTDTEERERIDRQCKEYLAELYPDWWEGKL